MASTSLNMLLQLIVFVLIQPAVPAVSLTQNQLSGSKKIDAEGCGLRPITSPFIVGGEEVNPPNSWPFICSIRDKELGHHIGGGSLIKSRDGTYYLVTVSHMFDLPGSIANPSRFGVYCATHYVDGTDDQQAQILQPEAIYRHSQYNINTYENDIAIITLSTAPVENDKLQPICLPTIETRFGELGTVLGWGSTLEGSGTTSPVLREASKPISSTQECLNAYGNAFHPSSMICAGYLGVGGIDSCAGDSGGPLAVLRNGTYELAVSGLLLGEECQAINEELCGMPNVQPIARRVVGGSEALNGALPWVILLTGNNVPVCGGAIISRRVVVTAAHCFENRPANVQWQVVSGKHHADRFDEGEQTHEVSKIIMHENYDTVLVTNDVALLILTENITYTNTIRPICLPASHQTTPYGQNCLFAGWGDTQDTGESVVLNQVTLQIQNDSTCSLSSWYGTHFIPRLHFCAGFEEGGRDACTGDSGSPLICKIHNRWILSGVSSWGYGCAQPKWPGVYTNVHHYVKWMEQKLLQEELLPGCLHIS